MIPFPAPVAAFDREPASLSPSDAFPSGGDSL